MGVLPKLRRLPKDFKPANPYRLSLPAGKRHAALDEVVNYKLKKGATKRDAAIQKKRRLGILRIYRRYKQPAECKKITRDMRYLDRKYIKNGTTNDICKGS